MKILATKFFICVLVMFKEEQLHAECGVRLRNFYLSKLL